LSLFKTVVTDLTRAEERHWWVITNWLYKAFKVDEEQWKL
jgi:rubrerythrin